MTTTALALFGIGNTHEELATVGVAKRAARSLHFCPGHLLSLPIEEVILSLSDQRDGFILRDDPRQHRQDCSLVAFDGNQRRRLLSAIEIVGKQTVHQRPCRSSAEAGSPIDRPTVEGTVALERIFCGIISSNAPSPVGIFAPIDRPLGERVTWG